MDDGVGSSSTITSSFGEKFSAAVKPSPAITIHCKDSNKFEKNHHDIKIDQKGAQNSAFIFPIKAGPSDHGLCVIQNIYTQQSIDQHSVENIHVANCEEEKTHLVGVYVGHKDKENVALDIKIAHRGQGAHKERKHRAGVEKV